MSEEAVVEECKDLDPSEAEISDENSDPLQGTLESGEFCFISTTTSIITTTTSSSTTTIPADVEITVYLGFGLNLFSNATFLFVGALAKTIPENNEPPLIFYASFPDLSIPTPAIEAEQNFYFGLFVSSYCIGLREVALTLSYGPFWYGPNIKGSLLGLSLYFQLPEEEIETIILEVLESYRPKLEKLNKELSKMSEIEIMSLTLSNEEEQLVFLNKLLE